MSNNQPISEKKQLGRWATIAGAAAIAVGIYKILSPSEALPQLVFILSCIALVVGLIAFVGGLIMLLRQ